MTEPLRELLLSSYCTIGGNGFGCTGQMLMM